MSKAGVIVLGCKFLFFKSESGTGEMVGGLIGVVLGMCVRFTCELS